MIPVITVLAAWLVIYLIDSAIPGPSLSDVPRPADPGEAPPSLPEAHATRAPHFRRLVPRS